MRTLPSVFILVVLVALGGPGGDELHADIERAAPSLHVERRGGRLPAATMGLTRIGRTLWIGTRAVLDVSRPDLPVRGGLARIDLDGGAARIFEAELPQVVEHDGPQPVWTSGAAALGGRTYLASYHGLVVVDGDRVTLLPVELAPGEPVHANVIAADPGAARARIWLGTDRGLVAVAPEDGVVVAHLGPSELGGEHVVGASLDARSGALYAAVHGQDGTTRAVSVRGDRVVSSLVPEDGGEVVAVAAAPGRGGAFVAVRSFDAARGGVFLWRAGAAATRIVDEGALAAAARGRRAPFGTSVVIYDEESDLLLVGGQQRPGGPAAPIVGGGLAWIDLAGAAPRVAGISTETSAMRGDHVVALAWDPARSRTYAALRAPCDEVRLGNIGVETITFEDGAPRFERTLLSGVRDVEVDGDQVTLALRDGAAGLRCEGVAMQEGLVHLRGDGTGAVPQHHDGEAPAFHPNRVAVVTVATEGRSVAMASREWGLFLGAADGVLLNPFGELGVSRRLHDVAFVGGEDVVWLAGSADHHPGDPPEAADRGNRGVTRLERDPSGRLRSVRRYVPRVTGREPGDIVTGLPSGDVRAVIPDGDGGVFLVCGRERFVSAFEHVSGEPFDDRDGPRLGGVARVDAGGRLTVLAGGDVVPDGRAGALAPDGTLHVLDAEHGLLAWDGERFVSVPLPAEVERGSEPTALWVGAGGDLAASFTTGVAIRLGGVATFVDGVGAAWRAAERAPGVLLVGTDEGLLRVSAPGARDVVEAVPARGERPPFRAN
jgi:hypothetical protein